MPAACFEPEMEDQSLIRAQLFADMQLQFADLLATHGERRQALEAFGSGGLADHGW